MLFLLLLLLLQAFDLGINPSLPTHARFGFCAFTAPKSSTYTEEERQTSQHQHQPGMGHHHSSCDTKEEDDHESSPEPSPLLSPHFQTTTPTHTTDKTNLMEDMMVTADDHTSTEMSPPPTATTQRKQSTMPWVGDQLCLPSLKHFALACAAYLDKEASAAKKKMTLTASQGGGNGGEEAPSKIVISVFVILTDQNRRFPRPRLSSLPHGMYDVSRFEMVLNLAARISIYSVLPF